MDAPVYPVEPVVAPVHIYEERTTWQTKPANIVSSGLHLLHAFDSFLSPIYMVGFAI